jgi:ABC-type multidrug transport system fused ATPase/permease subunit/CRP-like cAMP-binding protein
VNSGDHATIQRRRFGAAGAILSALAPSLRRQRRQLALSIALVIVAVALGAAIPRLVKALLYHETTTLIVVFVAVLIADPIFNLLAHLRTAKVSLAAGFDLRTRVFAGVSATHRNDVDASVRANATANTGALVDKVEHAFDSLIIGGLAGVLRIAAALSFLALINVAAALLMLGVMPLFFLAQRQLAKRLLVADQIRLESTDHVATVVDESITAVSTARGLSLGPWFGRRLAVQAHHLDEASYEQLRLEARLHLATRIVALIGIGAVTALGISDEGSAGDLIAALLYIELAVVGLESLPAMLRALQQGEASCARLAGILDTPTFDTAISIADAGDAGDAAAITLVGPDGQRLDIAPGRWIALVDATGADPVAWLGGLDEPTSGQVTIDDTPAALASRSRRVASVTAQSKCVNASTLEHLRAIVPAIDDTTATALLSRFGIAHLTELPNGGLDAPLGVQGALLSADERHRLLLSMAVAARPGALVLGHLRPLIDPDMARPVIAALRETGATVLMATNSAALAADADAVLFITTDHWYLASHHDLLMSAPGYVEQWQQGSIDTVAIGALAAAGPLEREALQNRMITERYEPGETIYREGAPADRVVLVVSGRVEITTGAGTDNERRLAVIEPGNACGDLRLTPDERRAETARAIDLVVVRTIGRAVWEAGMGGLLREDAAERRVLASILRRGALTFDELSDHLPDDDAAELAATVNALLSDGALRQQATGELTIGVSKRRAPSPAAGTLLDRITGV